MPTNFRTDRRPNLLNNNQTKSVKNGLSIPKPFTSKLTVNVNANINNNNNNKRSSINHASKPGNVNTIPLTPSRRLVNQTNVISRAHVRPQQKPLPPLPKIETQPPPSQPVVRLDPNPEVPVLELMPFGKQPYVHFNTVTVNTTHIKYITIRNVLDNQQQLFVKTFPKAEKGLNIDATEFLIAPKTEILVALAWTPTSVGSFRDTITLEDINRRPHRIIINGSAVGANHIAPCSNINYRKFMPKPTALAKLSPTKSVRSNRMQHHQNSAIKPNKRLLTNKDIPQLSKLVYAARRRQSGQIVKKILSKHDDTMATKIQSYFRMILAKRELDALKKKLNAILVIQSFARMILAKRQLRKKILAITFIQTRWRGSLARRRYSSIKTSALAIQKNWRRVLSQRRLVQLRDRHQATLKIQSYFRMIIAQRQLKSLKSKCQAATKIQAHWRGVLARRELEKLMRVKRAAVTIQSHWRGYLARRDCKKTMEAVLAVQSYIRMILVKREIRLKTLAATRIQTCWRGLMARRKLKLAISMIVQVQCNWRRILAKRTLNRLRQRRDACIKIQSYFRMILAKRTLDNLRLRNGAAIKIQSRYKGLLARRSYVRLRKQTIEFQTICRGFILRREFKKSLEAALRILNRSSEMMLNVGPIQESLI